MAYWVAAVDDDSVSLRASEHILEHGGFSVSCFSSGREILDFVKDNKPDLILLSLNMQEMDGFETMNRLHMDLSSSDIPVIIVSSDDDPDIEAEALSTGAIDFIVKPFAAEVLQLRIGNAIELIRLQSDLRSEVNRMTAEIVEEHKKNERLSLQIVKTLAGTIDAKDSFTNGHSLRVAEYSREIARRAGYNEKRQNDIYMAGLLHDVGKIGVPDSIINKPSKLTDEEFAIIKQHPVLGYEILINIRELPKLAVAARWHHERYDGRGYPDHLKGTSIPEEARIIGVADAYDAMSSNRSFHNVLDQEYILDELRRGKGVQFDPQFADIMIKMVEEDKEYKMREQKLEKTEEAPVIEIVNQDADSAEKTAALFRMLEACGVSTESGMKYCMNDVGFYIEMLNEFTAGAGDRISNIQKLFDSGDWNKYRLSIHSLKSLAKTLGLTELSEMTRLSEEAVKKVDIDFVKNNHKKITDHVTGISDNIKEATAYIS